jgi:hypothetical protein
MWPTTFCYLKVLIVFWRTYFLSFLDSEIKLKKSMNVVTILSKTLFLKTSDPINPDP